MCKSANLCLGGYGWQGLFIVAIRTRFGLMCVQIDFGQAGAQGLQSGLATGWGELALPHNQHIVAKVVQLLVDAAVSCLVALKLVAPEVGVGRWYTELATVMTMPETSIDHDDRALAAQHDIGCAR